MTKNQLISLKVDIISKTGPSSFTIFYGIIGLNYHNRIIVVIIQLVFCVDFLLMQKIPVVFFASIFLFSRMEVFCLFSTSFQKR